MTKHQGDLLTTDPEARPTEGQLLEPRPDKEPTSHPFRIESGVRDRYRTLSIGLASTDAIAIFIALLVSFRIRWRGDEMPPEYLIVMIAAPLAWIAIFKASGLYAPQLLSPWEEFKRTITASSLGIVGLTVTSFWTRASFSRIWVVLTFVIVLLLEIVSRRAWQGYVRRRRIDGRLSLRTVVIGMGPEAERLCRALEPAHSGFTPVGFVAPKGAEKRDLPMDVLGDTDDLVQLIYDYGIDCLFLAVPNIDQRQMVHIAQVARQQNAEIRLSANLPEILTPRLTVQPLEGIMTLSVRPVQLTGAQTVLKRGFDMVASAAGLLILWPLLVAIAVTIRATLRSPALFKQPRVTKGGHVFKVYKFRTMGPSSDDYIRTENIDPSRPFFKLGEEDPRVTRFGRFLRRTSLDELPQLINVIKGEMSLVGPRPLPAEQVAANLDLLGPRHEVRAGVTGWWQVHGRSEVEDPDEAVRLDLFYIENWSLFLDVFILLKTIGAVLRKRGAM